MDSVQISRYIIAMAWVYHGVFPKLLHVAPLEQKLTSTIGLSIEHSYLLSKTAGFGEVIFGVLFLAFYKTRLINYANIAALSGLLLFTAVQLPSLLIEAFNPVTTNIPLIGLSLVILARIKSDATLAK